MWINRFVYDSERMEYVKNREEARVLAVQNASHLATIDWMKTQINQLQHERAQLMFMATGARVQVPEIAKATPLGENPLLHMPTDFQDVGDEIAEQLGIYHAPDGTLTDTKPAPIEKDS
jgi:hypothetical protein